MKDDPNKATASIILETRFPRKDGRCPVKLRVTYKRQSRYYIVKNEDRSTIAMSSADYNRTMTERPRIAYRPMKKYLINLEKLATDTIAKIPSFSFALFEKKHFNLKIVDNDLIAAISNAEKELKENGQISTASTYYCARKSLEKFTGKAELPFEKFDTDFLSKYESWLMDQGKSRTTLSIYLRATQAVFNAEKRSGNINIESPFGKDAFQIPKGRNVKKALKISQVAKIAKYKALNGSQEQRFRDYWLFSYLCNGINPKDIANIKYGNIDGDVLTLIRAKTAKQKEAQEPITIIVTKGIRKIIDRWGNKPAHKEQYLFPILSAGLTPQEEYRKTQQLVKNMNKYVDRIAKKLKMKEHVTTYVARHSFAQALKDSGASKEFIGESLGHASTKTTDNYLKDFELSVKRGWAEKVGKL